MQEDALPAGANVVVIDDLIATGGSAFAAHQLVDQAKAKVIQNLFVVDVRLPPFFSPLSIFFWPGSRLARSPGGEATINPDPLLTRPRWCPNRSSSSRVPTSSRRLLTRSSRPTRRACSLSSPASFVRHLLHRLTQQCL